MLFVRPIKKKKENINESNIEQKIGWRYECKQQV